MASRIVPSRTPTPCGVCKKVMLLNNLRQHMRTAHSHVRRVQIDDDSDIVTCSWEHCRRSFLSQKNLDLHMKVHEGFAHFSCWRCKRKFATLESKNDHVAACTVANRQRDYVDFSIGNTGSIEGEPEENGISQLGGAAANGGSEQFRLVKAAFNSRVTQYRKVFGPDSEPMDGVAIGFITHLQETCFHGIREVLRNTISSIGNIKYQCSIRVSFYKATNAQTLTDPPPSFNAEAFRLMSISDGNDQFDLQAKLIFNSFMSQIENYQTNGSGWLVSNLVDFTISLASYDPSVAFQAGSWRPLPKYLEKRRGLLSIRNFNDECCFLWSILAHRYSAHVIAQHSNRPKNLSRVNLYKPYEHTLNMNGNLLLLFPLISI